MRRTKRAPVSWSTRAALLTLTLAVGVGAWQLPDALELRSWTEDAADSRAVILDTNDEIEAVGSTTAKVESSLAGRTRANQGLERRLAKERTTISSLEERVRELGGDPDSP
jgi:hypothetical protein